MDKNNIPWDQKKEQLYFHGAITGEKFDKDGNFINRLKLMSIAHENPDLIHFTVSDDAFFYTEEVPEYLKKGKEIFREKLCERMDFKYMIAMDGNIAGW